MSWRRGPFPGNERPLGVTPGAPFVRRRELARSPSPSLWTIRKILVTGMSGAGKSSALEALRQQGFRTVDTDEGDWTEWSEAEGGYVWYEDRIAEVLARDDGSGLYISGTVSNQGRFYDRFDAVVLLSAPAEALLARIEDRTTNPYGKTPAQRELVLRHLAEVEPLLRGTCTHEIDATQPLANVVDQLAELGREPPASIEERRSRGRRAT